ncbi:hypothetical protein NL108_012810 [Boleophthalmus pectinirostris]|nr:hypothetical protein NL108_012810 [Boleophthalmus pectinirostris]
MEQIIFHIADFPSSVIFIVSVSEVERDTIYTLDFTSYLQLMIRKQSELTRTIKHVAYFAFIKQYIDKFNGALRNISSGGSNLQHTLTTTSVKPIYPCSVGE